MKTKDKIKSLQQEIKKLECQIKNCSHIFADPIFDPEYVSIQDDKAGYEEHGVNRWPISSFHTEEKSRWSRECNLCGHKEYTYKQSPVTTEYKPNFN